MTVAGREYSEALTLFLLRGKDVIGALGVAQQSLGVLHQFLHLPLLALGHPQRIAIHRGRGRTRSGGSREQDGGKQGDGQNEAGMWILQSLPAKRKKRGDEHETEDNECA